MIEPIYQQWYFHRPALAAQLLDAFARGTGDPIALMGARRIGKTLFLLNDLLPAAAKRGFVGVYVDLWQQRDQPLEAVNYALEEAIDDIEVPTTKLKRRLATPVKKVGFPGGSIDLGEEPTRRRPSDPALLVDWLLKRLLTAAGKPILLVFDEVQELANVADGERIVSAIRSAITRRKSHVRVIFTGSSEVALRELLSRSRAALYEGASTIAFPHLDATFLRFVVDRVSTRLNRVIDAQELAEAFERLHHRPRSLIDLVLLFASSTARSLRTLLDAHIEAQLSESDFEGQWIALKPLHQAICLAIARGEPVTAQATREAYGRYLGRLGRRGGVSPGTVVSGLRTLQSTHVITRKANARGHYQFDDPFFGEWLRRYHDQASLEVKSGKRPVSRMPPPQGSR